MEAEEASESAIRAVDDTVILPYFLEEVQRQDQHCPGSRGKNFSRERRTLRTPACSRYGGGVYRPHEGPLAAAVERRRGASAALSLGHGEAPNGSARGPMAQAEWLTASLESALKSSDDLPLVNHLRTLTSRLFSENEWLKRQAPSNASFQQAQRGRPPPVHSLDAEEAVRLARRLAQENSYLETFISTDARVLQSAALVKAQRERAEALENNRRLQQQAEKDRQIIVELELKSRAFADAYAWLTSHNRMIHAKDAPALVALWRRRVAAATASKKGSVAPEFTKDLAGAYAAADSEGDTETASEDGREKKTKEDLLIAAELREAEAVTEARQAQAYAARAEARAAAAEQQLAVVQTQLERLKNAAAASAASAAASASAAAPAPASCPSPTPPGGAEEEQLQAALRDVEKRAEAAENECRRMKTALETLQATLDLTASEKRRLEQELAEAVAAADAKLTAQTKEHAVELAKLQAQHSQDVESMKTSVNEAAKVKRELEEMRQQCAEMSAQLAAAKEKGTGDGLTKAASPGGLASPSTSDISTLTSERDNYKATALRLEMDIKRLSARAAEATQLEKTVAALKEKLQAGEELKTAYAALQSETQALRSQLGAKKSQPVAPKGLEAHGETTDSTAIKKERDALREEVSALREQLAKLREETESLKTGGRSMQAPQATGSEDTSSKEATLTAAEVAELVRERNALQERVRLLEKELEALRQLAKSPAKAPPAPKSAPSPTPTTESPQPPSSKKPPVPTSKGQTIPTSAGLSASADTAVTGKRDKANQPCEALEPRAAEVSPPTAAKALPAATASSTDAPDCSPSEANSATKAALPRKFIPPAGPKVPPVAPPKEVAKTLGGPLPLEGHAKDVPPNNARPVVGKPLPSALLPKATAAPAAAFSSEGTTTPDGQRQPEPHVAAKGTADARVTTAKVAGPSKGKNVPPPLPLKAAKAKAVPVSPSLESNATLLEGNADVEPKIPISKKSEPPLSKMEPGAGLASQPRTASADSGVSGGGKAAPSSTVIAADSDIAVAKSTAASVGGAKGAGTTLPKMSAKGTKVPAPPKKAPPVESPVPAEEVISKEAKQELEKEVADLREQLAAGEELKRAYETLKKENESLQAKLDAAGALKGLPEPPSAVGVSVEKPETVVSVLHGDYAAVAKERDWLAEKVKALEQELAGLRNSQKAPPLSKVLPDRKLVQGSKALPICKGSFEPSGKPQAVDPAKETSAPAGEETPAQAHAKLEYLEQEVLTLRQQLADGQKIKDDYATLVEEAKKLRSENEKIRMQGARDSPVKRPDDSSSEQSTLTAAEVAELLNERNALRERVRDLEEELAALRTSTRSPTKAPPAFKSVSPATSTPQTSERQPSKKPPVPTPKLEKPLDIPSTDDHRETSPGDDAARVPPSETAGPSVAAAKPRPFPSKAAKPVAEASSPGVVAPCAEGGAASPVKAGPPVSKKLPGSLQPKAAKASSATATPADNTTTTDGSQAEVMDTVGGALKNMKSPGTLPLKTASPKGPPLATSVDGPASVPTVKAKQASSKSPEAPQKAPAAVPASQPRTASADSGISGGGEAAPSSTVIAADSDIAVAKSTAASVDGAKGAGTTLPKMSAKGTKVPAPPKKAPPVESPVPAEEVISKEAKQELEKEVADLREQLAAGEELKRAYETLKKENESLQAKLDAAGALKGLPEPPVAGDKSVVKPEMALSEANQLKATAELEAQLSVLRPKAEAAEALEKDVRRLQEQLSASEELRAAHEALKKETNALKEQLKELQSKSGQPVKPVDTKAAGKGQSLADGELQALLRERDELRERVRALEKNMAAASGTTMQGDTVHPTGKEAPAQRGSGGALPAKKPLPPLPKREHAASAEPAAAEFPAGEKGDETSPEETVVGLLPPVAAKAVDAQEPRATEPATGSEGLPPKKLEPSVGKTAPSLKAGEEPHTGQKGEEAGGSYKTLPKSAKKPPPPPHKPAEKDTKVPPPPKKAPPVEAPSGDLVELTSEVKGNLEKEIASLREQLAAAEELKTTHEALQREFIALQGELKSLKAQAKASESEEKVETGEPAEPQPQETELLRKERNTLRERVAALEAELSNLRASEAHGVAIPKTKGTLPPKLRPGKSPLPAKAPKQADAKAYAQTSGRAGERKDESRLSSTGVEVAKEGTCGETKPESPSMKGAAGEGPPDKASLLTEEVLSKSDAETEVGDSGAESSPAEERVAELTERLQRAKRRVRNLVIKCNALVELEKERDALRSQLESLQAKHEAISKLHEKEAKDKLAVAGADKAEADSMLKSASAAALSASAVASTVADDPEGVATMNRSLTTQSSSALLDVQPPADWAEKYEKVKAQRDKVYQAYKAQKERITSLEEEEAITKERLERVERLYQETKEELEIVTRPPKQREGAESAGILSWLGGGAHDEKPPEEQKLRARLELLQQRLQKALAENEALSSKLAQMRTSPTGSPRGDSAAGGEATTEQSQGRPSQHLSPHTVSKGAGSEALSAKDPSATHPGPVRGEDSEAERKSLTELQQQVKQKDAQIEKYKAEILKLKASAVPVSGESSVAAELAKKEQELQAKTAELEKVTKDASDKEALIREKTEEVKTLKARLEALEKEKRQALDDNSALKKELETLQKELEAMKAGRSAPTPAKEKPKPPSSGDATSPATKAVKRSSSIAKRMPGLPPPAPASRADRPDTAAVGVGEAREEEHEAASSKAAQKVATGPSDEQLKKSEENSKARDEKEGEPSADQVSKKKTKKASADSDGESKPRKSPKEDSEGIKKKKKKKKKAEASGEKSAEQSDVESGVMHNDVDETTAAADATSSWGFGFFGNSEGNDASKKDATEKEASPSAPRPSLLGLIVGADPVEEAPKGNEVPPLKLSTVDGADDQSDSSSSEDGETDGGITSTIAGFFWGI